MADTKISALTASTTPLAGTEVLPIVQSGTTKQVSVANLTAGRAISATQLTLTTGNLIVASGQGIDFSATPGTGTSELLDDYEEGTWTPAYNTTNNDISGLGYFRRYGFYTKVGNIVTVTFSMATNNAAGIAGTGSVTLTGLPFAVALASGDFFAASVSNGRFTSSGPTFVNGSSANPTALAFGTAIGVAELLIANFTATNTNNYNITAGSFSYRVS
jgi:hypothetical protein